MDSPKPMQQAAQEGKEDPGAVNLVRINSAGDFKRFKYQIRRLTKDVLGTPQTPEEEEKGIEDVEEPEAHVEEKDIPLDDMDKKYIPRSEKGELWAAVRRGRVVAFVALRKVEGPKNYIAIEEFKMPQGKQQGVFKSVMRQLVKEMQMQNFARVVVKPTGGAESRFTAFRREAPGFLSVVKEEGGKEVEVADEVPERQPEAVQ